MHRESTQTKRSAIILEARRRFLATCGNSPIATPPAVTLMLASAQSIVKDKGNNGFGNGGGDPAPGNSAHNNSPNAGQKLADKVR